MRRLTNIGCVGAIMLATGCAGILPALQAASQAGQLIGSLLDVADQGTSIYYDRHPNDAASELAAEYLRDARAALAAYNQTVGDPAATAEQITNARSAVLAAYGTLRDALASAGVLDAKAPPGGAESDTLIPAPINLPTADDLEASITRGDRP